MRDLVRCTLEAFARSDATTIGNSHVPENSLVDNSRMVELAMRVWRRLHDARVTPHCTHEMLWKIFALETERWPCWMSLVMVDEGQDLTPCQLSTIRAFRAGTLLVYDQHQRRGADCTSRSAKRPRTQRSRSTPPFRACTTAQSRGTHARQKLRPSQLEKMRHRQARAAAAAESSVAPVLKSTLYRLQNGGR